ncbi:MAG: hypothetical protein H0W64_09765 [Gammaproteobacteria bacterium]|nr:hypothetical protein [Gammaproteobacteria bacterium]
MTQFHKDCEQAAKHIVDTVGKTIVLAMPIGIGKPIGFLNALYRLAESDASISLTIITGLTLARQHFSSKLEERFVLPIQERLLGNYEDPLYEKARVEQTLPKNISVIEFFLAPGKYLHNQLVQRHYVSTKYTSVIKDLRYYQVNVIAQQVSQHEAYPNVVSLSSNADLFTEVMRYITQQKAKGHAVAAIAEVNQNLPFMLGDALTSTDQWTDLIDTKQYHHLFNLPREEINLQDHLIGLYTSTLIKDNSCLQIGIGRLGLALSNALILRQHANENYRQLLSALEITSHFKSIIDEVGNLECFEHGVYGSTEMLSDEYMHLYKNKILKKYVYEHKGLQQLLNENLIQEKFTPDILNVLLDAAIINEKLSSQDVTFLQRFGIFKPTIQWIDNTLFVNQAMQISNDLSDSHAKDNIVQYCLGEELQGGVLTHAAFFLGSNNFYDFLHALPVSESQRFCMTAVNKTNALSLDPELLRVQRKDMRCVNTGMMVTLGGNIISDGLENYKEVSGVGGQFDFMYMAYELPDARAIINCRSTREKNQQTVSNIIWDYPAITIPRYLRDIVITEFGIADCRSKTDQDIIKNLLNITDSRFQRHLLELAKRHGKIEANYNIPQIYQNNYLNKIQTRLHQLKLDTFFTPYPFGSDLTPVEACVKKVLEYLKQCTRAQLVWGFFSSFSLRQFKKSHSLLRNCLNRLELDVPQTLTDLVYQKVFIYGYSKTWSKNSSELRSNFAD